MIVAKPFLAGRLVVRPDWSEDAADYTAFGADGGTVDGYGLRTGYECDDRGDLFRSFKAFKQRTRAHTCEKLFFDFRRRDILLLGHVLQEAADTFRGRWTGQNGINGDSGASDGLGEAAGDRD